MTRQKNEDKKDSIQSGLPQFTTQKRKIICDFKIFKEMSDNRPTDTDKGKYAEALLRDLLEQFLPAKYDVTPGYLIQQRDVVKLRSALKEKLCHYDIIISNRLDSPVFGGHFSIPVTHWVSDHNTPFSKDHTLYWVLRTPQKYFPLLFLSFSRVFGKPC